MHPLYPRILAKELRTESKKRKGFEPHTSSSLMSQDNGLSAVKTLPAGGAGSCLALGRYIEASYREKGKGSE